ncbi:MAG TPA: YaiO family outer membrane beta-barrel protein [Burkholderiales bacterium]|nr:YaiO family outer membrane beta-barrel protein [Burkholderiales bacterium]
MAAAADMAREGRDADALVAFQRIAAANPNDHLARLWIARLQERMGNVARAEAVYRSVLLEDRTNVDAMLGVGTSLIARDAADEALDFLEDAEQRDASNIEVLTALARAHQQLGHDAVAISYWQRVVAMAPTERNQTALEAALIAHGHRFEARAAVEQFGANVSDTRDADLRVNLHVKERLRFIGRANVQRKFGEDDARGGGGLEWRWKPQTTLIGHAIVGPGNRIMPEGDYLGSIDHTYHSTGWTGSFRYFDFTGARVVTFSPAARWSMTDRVAIGVMYALSETKTSINPGTTTGHTLTLRSSYQWKRRTALDVGYARGVENFENFSIDQIGGFTANTITIGPRFQLPNLMSISGAYQRQWRSDSLGDMNRFVVAVGRRF